jgi:oligogalacturonide lyase
VSEGGYTGMLNLARKSMKLYFMRKAPGAGSCRSSKSTWPHCWPTAPPAGKLKPATPTSASAAPLPAELEAGGDMALDADEDWVYFRVGSGEAARHLAPAQRSNRLRSAQDGRRPKRHRAHEHPHR